MEGGRGEKHMKGHEATGWRRRVIVPSGRDVEIDLP